MLASTPRLKVQFLHLIVSLSSKLCDSYSEWMVGAGRWSAAGSARCRRAAGRPWTSASRPPGTVIEAPAVRAADQIFRILVPLVADVEVVGDARAQGEVVADLRRRPGRSRRRRTGCRSPRCRRRPDAVLRVAVAVDEGLDEGVVRGAPADRPGHGQPALRCRGCRCRAGCPTAVETSTSATLSGRPWVGFAKCVYLTVAKLRELMTHDPSAVPIFSGDSLPVPEVADGVGGERVARVDALRVAVADVEEDRLRGREGQLAEALVARAVVVRGARRTGWPRSSAASSGGSTSRRSTAGP